MNFKINLNYLKYSREDGIIPLYEMQNLIAEPSVDDLIGLSEEGKFPALKNFASMAGSQKGWLMKEVREYIKNKFPAN